jgi:hypothetical protein
MALIKKIIQFHTFLMINYFSFVTFPDLELKFKKFVWAHLNSNANPKLKLQLPNSNCSTPLSFLIDFLIEIKTIC